MILGYQMKIRFRKSILRRIVLLLFILFVINLSIFSILGFAKKGTTISMTETGFEPSEVSVSAFSTITFRNDDIVPRWPASNLHPTHEEYAEFDPLKEIGPGESWTFTPQKSGVWKFHDHLNPHMRGTLTVKESSKIAGFFQQYLSLSSVIARINNFNPLNEETQELEDTTQATILLNKNEKEQYAILKSTAQKSGAIKAWALVTDTYSTNPGGQGPVHDLAHYAGTLLFEELAFEGIRACNPLFAFGCYHGFLDAAFAKDLKDLPKAEEACLKVGPQGTGPYASCIHGIGHGIASYYGVEDLENSLKSCESLSGGEEYCFDGVFMEFEREASDSFYKKDDPLYPCNAIEEKYVFSCGRNQVNIMLNRLTLTKEQAAQLCNESESEALRFSCADSLGFHASYQAQGEAQNIINFCQIFTDPDLHAHCVISAAGELIFQDVEGWETTAPQTCKELEEPYATDCTYRTEQIQREYGRTPKEN